ncbi:MAG: GNAT family N-acetyltransferase [Candidatus Omnitrophota bacterium]
MIKDNKEILMEIASGTGVFRDCDLSILDEVAGDCFKNPPEYTLLSENIDGKKAGFIIFGRTPLTDFAWDIYWVVVDKQFQGRGLGTILIKKAEDHITREQPRAVIRIETSTREEYSSARRLYIKTGYGEVGTIPNFYSANDGITFYSKEIKTRGD